MLRVIKNANLPSAPVKLCAIGEGNSNTEIQLRNLGINTISLKTSAALIKGERTHADMLLLHLGGSEIVLSKEQSEYISLFESFGFSPKVLSFDLKSAYPFNVILNAAIINDKFFAHQNTINIFSKHKNFAFYPVKQGYAKCSACIINETAVITEDENIYDSMKRAGLDVLKIKKGEVRLKGMNYGFFGGASGKLSQNILAINGELSYNSEKDDILSFLNNYSIDIISLKSGPLEDIGGIIPLLEEEK